MGIDFGVAAAYILGIILIFIIGRVFLVPLKIFLKLIYNALVGGLTLVAVNFIGGYFGYHIALNVVSSLVVGLLGIPGLALLAVMKAIL